VGRERGSAIGSLQTGEEMRGSLLSIAQQPDVFGLLTRSLNIAALLRLSMTSRAFRNAIDADDERMAQDLGISNWDENSIDLAVFEYSDSVVVRLDCAKSKRLRMMLLNVLTGRSGEFLRMGVEIHGMHTDETYQSKVASTRVRSWRCIYVHSEIDIPPQNRYGVYTMTFACIDPNIRSNKQVLLVLQNVELHQQMLKRRCLLALRAHHACMLCNSRLATFCAVDCPEPYLRKVCTKCAHDSLVTERTLVRDWHVAKHDMAALRQQALRFYSIGMGHFVTWITRRQVCRHFECESWEHFTRTTRARRLFGNGWRGAPVWP